MKITAVLLLAVATLISVAPMAWAQPASAMAPPAATAAYKCPRELCEIKVEADDCGVRVDRRLAEVHDVALLR